MIQLIRGFKDILPGEVELWQKIEQEARALFESFGFREIRIPIMEKTELFKRSIGEDTDIVEKEMYTFADRGGEMVTLRPEATASIVRAYIQHKLYAPDPARRLYMIGPMFRRERPQKGRYRQFYQIDAEVLGVKSPLADAQLVYILVLLLERLNVAGAEAHINSLGCHACRPDFRTALQKLLASVGGRLCEDCTRRKGRNPLRVLDCKVPACREALSDAPSVVDYLCAECRRDFDELQAALTSLGVPYIVDKRLVRGLDYYTRATFEIQTGELGAQSAVAGGGRYDKLVKELGGPDLPATGFAIGFDRLAEIVGLQAGDYRPRPDLFLAALGERSRSLAFDWCCRLGREGVRVEMEFGDKSLKSLMKSADRLGAPYVLMIGDKELGEKIALLRDMRTKEQVAVPFDGVIETVKRMKRSQDIGG
ncbi:MAG: histidine--tRNA ligase [Desulfobacterales bacterium]|jgi:histidyl-tRNA synthetase|nr:histidine--tRNA ligase [Desulfobacterales bacterium]